MLLSLALMFVQQGWNQRREELRKVALAASRTAEV